MSGRYAKKQKTIGKGDPPWELMGGVVNTPPHKPPLNSSSRPLAEGSVSVAVSACLYVSRMLLHLAVCGCLFSRMLQPA